MPKKCKGRRNALVVTVAAVLSWEVFLQEDRTFRHNRRPGNAGETKRTQMTESATQRMDLTDAFCSDITRCDEEIYRRICSR